MKCLLAVNLQMILISIQELKKNLNKEIIFLVKVGKMFCHFQEIASKVCTKLRYIFILLIIPFDASDTLQLETRLSASPSIHRRSSSPGNICNLPGPSQVVTHPGQSGTNQQECVLHRCGFRQKLHPSEKPGHRRICAAWSQTS